MNVMARTCISFRRRRPEVVRLCGARSILKRHKCADDCSARSEAMPSGLYPTASTATQGRKSGSGSFMCHHTIGHIVENRSWVAVVVEFISAGDGVCVMMRPAQTIMGL